MDDVKTGRPVLTAQSVQKLMKITGETEAEVRAAAERQGFEVEDLPTLPPMGMYL